MKKMKKTNLFLLAFAGMMCAPVSAYDFSAVTEHEHEYVLYNAELYYTINADGTTVTISKGPESYNAQWVKIPESVEHEGKTYTVTAIGYEAFADSKLGTVLMANSITEIQDYAFKNSDVDSVSFSTGLKSIGKYAFDHAYQLTSAILHEGVETIGKCAFHEGGYYNSPGLQQVYLPNSVKEIGEDAFSYQLNLNRVRLPEGLKELKAKTFQYCPSLKDIVLPESLETIGEATFQDCQLQEVNFPSSLKEIGKNAFTGCRFTEIVLPENVKTVGESAFYRNVQLTSIAFSKGMTTLPKQVCSSCSQLITVTIPEGITCIEYGTFEGCERLSHISFPESVTMLGDRIFGRSGICNFEFPKNITVIPNSMFAECNYLKEITIPNGITTIGAGAFRDCPILTTCHLPETVTRIESTAFDGCELLSNLTLPSQVKFIGESALRDCKAIEKMEIPATVKEIAQYAFSGCEQLKEITIPHETAVIGQYMLSGCPNLTAVHYQRAILPRIDGLANSPRIVDTGNSCTLYVPRGAKSTYEASPVWNNFMSIEEEDVPNVYYQIGADVQKGNGKVFVGDKEITYNNVDTLLNSSVVVTFVPADGYMIESILCNGMEISSETDSALEWEISDVDANYTFDVYYKETPVTLHLKAGQGGYIDLKIEKGERFTCNFQVEEGWSVNSVRFNQTDVTGEWNETDGFTTPQITGESTLSVSFEQTSHTVGKMTTSRTKAYAQSHGVLAIEGLTEGESIEIFTVSGILTHTFVATNNYHTFTLVPDKTYIVKTAKKTIKVQL